MSYTVNALLLSTSTPIAMSQNSDAVRLDRISRVAVTATVAAANPSNIAFTAVAATDICTTATAHGFTTGMLFQASTTTTLPAGLSAATNYYAIVLTTTTFKVATSQANALAGTAIDITSAGTGTHTVNVTTTLAGTIKLQKNTEPAGATAIWVDLDDLEVDNGNNSQTVSAAGNKSWAIWQVPFRELRAVVTVTSGTMTVYTRVHGKA